MPIAHATTRALERDFVVVHWDQRGAGKSAPRGFDAGTMSFERFLQDAREVTRHLKDRLGAERIVLLGHSWGTMLGTRLVARWPEDYAAYIGFGQQVSTARGIEVTLDRLAPLIRDGGRPGHLHWLEAATPEGLMEHRAYAETMMMLDAYGGGMNASLPRLAWMLVRAPKYSLGDLARWLDGARRGSGPMWPEYRSRDLIAEVPVMPVPMLLISGARDLNTPLEPVQEWLERVTAPRGKRHVVFEASGHAPFLTEPDRFTQTLCAYLREIETPR